MHHAWIILIVFASLLAVYVVLCLLIAKKFLAMGTTPIAHTIEEAVQKQTEEAKINFDDYFNKWQKQNFELDGVQGTVRGETIFHPEFSSQTIKKVAIVCHGHTWNRINSVKYGNVFYNQGYSLILYDHAYFGLSDGKFTSLGYYEKFDLSSVIDYARSVFGEDAFVALHGESMGAVTVLSELELRSDINLIVADCGFSNAMSYYRELAKQKVSLPSFPSVDFSNLMSKRKYGYDFKKSAPVKILAKTNVPICFIHGTQDKLIHYHHSVDMYNACQNTNCELHLFEDAIHARSILKDKERYTKVVTEFLNKIENLDYVQKEIKQ